MFKSFQIKIRGIIIFLCQIFILTMPNMAYSLEDYSNDVLAATSIFSSQVNSNNYFNKFFKRRVRTKNVSLNKNKVKIIDNYKLGIELTKSKRYKESLKFFDKHIESGNVSAAVYVERGWAKFCLGKTKDSLIDFEKAIKFDSGNKDAKAYLRMAKNKLGILEEQKNEKEGNDLEKEKIDLFEIVEKGDVDTLKKNIESGENLNISNKKGETLLHIASKNGHGDIVKFLISNGVNVRAKDNKGLAPIHCAAIRGYDLIIIDLLYNGAYVNQKDFRDETALHKAVRGSKDSTVEILLKCKAKTDLVNKDGDKALSLASKNKLEKQKLSEQKINFIEENADKIMDRFLDEKEANARKFSKDILDNMSEDRRLLLYALGELSNIEAVYVKDPLPILENLIKALTAKSVDYFMNKIKERIAYIANQYIKKLLLLELEENNKVFAVNSEIKKKLLKRIEDIKVKDIKNEAGLSFQLKNIKAGLRYLGLEMIDEDEKKFLRKILKHGILCIGKTGVSSGLFGVTGEIDAAGEIVKEGVNLIEIGKGVLKELKENMKIGWYRSVVWVQGVGYECRLFESLESLKKLQKYMKKNNSNDWKILYAGLEIMYEILETELDEESSEEKKKLAEDMKKELFLGKVNYKKKKRLGVIDYLGFNENRIGKRMAIKLGHTLPNLIGDETAAKHYDSWRIRSKALEICILELVSPIKEIREKAREVLLESMIKETDPRVRGLLENPEKVLAVRRAMKNTLKPVSDNNILDGNFIRDEIQKAWAVNKNFYQDFLNEEREILFKIQVERDKLIKGELSEQKDLLDEKKHELQEERQAFEGVLSNMIEVSRKMHLDARFAETIKRELEEIKEKLDVVTKRQEKQDIVLEGHGKHLESLKDLTAKVSEEQSVQTSMLYDMWLRSKNDPVVKPASVDEQYPGIWNVPLRNKDFIGRNSLLEDIKSHLQKVSRGEITQSVTAGLGGIGKTELVKEYVYRHKHEYNMVWWFNAENEVALLSDFVRFAKEVKIYREGKSSEEIVYDVLSFLDSHEGWLLVYDNADNPNMVSSYIPESGGHVLITSRNPNWKNKIEVRQFSREESINLIEKLTGQTDDRETADVLAKELGDLPLALSQACAYMVQTETTLMEYLDIFKIERKELWKDEEVPNDFYKNTVATTWKLSMKKIEQENKLSAELLRMCSFFAPDDIPKYLLKSWIQEKQPDIKTDLTLNKTLKVLQRYSMIQKSKGGYSIHRLVQTVVRDEMKKSSINLSIKEALSSLLNDVNYKYYEMSSWRKIEELLIHVSCLSDFINIDTEKFENIVTLLIKSSDYLLDVESNSKLALEFVEKSNEFYKRLSKKNGVVLSMINKTFAKAYYIKGEYKKAIEFYQEALKPYQKLKDKDNLNSAKIYYGLGLSYYMTNEYKKSKIFFEKSFQIRKNKLGKQDTYTAQSMTGLAKICRTYADYDGAINYFDKVIDIWLGQEGVGESHPDVAEAIQNLGGICLEKAQHGKAIEYFEKSLAIRIRELGEDHPAVANCYMGLGGIYYSKGDYRKTLEVYKEALEIRVSKLGMKHPDVAGTCITLANVYTALGDRVNHEKYLNEAMTIIKDKMPKDHTDLADCYLTLGFALDEKGDFDGAIEFYNKALLIFQKKYGSKHPLVASCYSALGRAFYNKGEYKIALDKLNIAFSVYSEFYSKNHTSFARIYNTMAHISRAKGLFDEALTYYEKGYKILVESIGEKHPDTLAFFLNKAAILTDLGEFDESIEMYDKVKKVYEETIGSLHPRMILVINNLGVTKKVAGKYKEAEDCFQESLSLALKINGEVHRDVAAAYNNLGTLYLELYKNDEALDCFKHSLEIGLKIFGESNIDLAKDYHNIAAALKQKGEYDESLKYYKKSLDIKLAILGRSLEVASTYNNMGNVYFEQGIKAKSLECFLKSFELNKEFLPEGHIDFALNYLNMGRYYREEGEVETAIEYNNKALDIYLAAKLGLKDLRIAKVYNSLGICYKIKGMHDEAIEYYKKSLNINLEVLGEKSSLVADGYDNIGIVYQISGDLEKAEEYELKAFELRKETLDENDLDLANSYNNLSNIYGRLGKREKAISFLEKAIAIRIEKLGKDNPLIASCYINLGIQYLHDGNNEESIKFSKKALAIRTAKYGIKDLEGAECHVTIGLALKSQGKYKDALLEFNKALDVNRVIVGNEHEDIARISIALGHVYFAMKEYDKALNCYQEALSIYEKDEQRYYSRTVILLSQISDVYIAKDDYPTAIEEYLKRIKLQLKIIGEKNKETGISYHILGDHYVHSGDYKNAKECYEKSLEIREPLMQEADVYIAETYFNLSVACVEEKDFDRAIQTASKSAEISKILVGKDDLSSARAYLSLAKAYRGKNEFSKAVDLLENVLDISKAKLGDNDPSVVDLYRELGFTHSLEDEFEMAYSYFELWIVANIERFDNFSSQVEFIAKDTANYYQENGDFARAVKYYLIVLKINPKDIDVLMLLARSHFTLKNYDQAIVMLKNIINIKPDLVDAYVLLGNIYIIKSQLEDAKPAFITVIALNEDSPVHHNLACIYNFEGDFENADMYFKMALDKNPMASTYAEYAMFLYRYNKYNDVKEYSLKSIQNKDDESSLCYVDNERETLISCLRREMLGIKRIEIKPCILAFYLQISSYIKQGFEEFIPSILSRYEDVVKEDGSLMAYSMLGYTFLEFLKYDKALECFNLVLDKKKKHYKTEMHSQIGVTYENIGDVLKNQNKLHQSEIFYKKSQKIFKQTMGVKSVVTKNVGTKLKKLTPFPSQVQAKENLDFTVLENIPQEVNIIIDSIQTSIASNTWNNQTNKGEIILSQSFVKFIQNKLDKTQYDDAVNVILNTELTQINQQKLTDKKYSLEINKEEFKDFEINTLLFSWINTSQDKLINYKIALESYWQYLTEENYKDKETHQQGVESYLSILDYVINNHEDLGGVINDVDVLLTLEAIRDSKIEMIDDDQIGNIERMAAA